MDRNTKLKIANNMIKFGGSFASNLGKTLMTADSDNTAKIVATWPDLIKKYHSFEPLIEE